MVLKRKLKALLFGAGRVLDISGDASAIRGFQPEGNPKFSYPEIPGEAIAKDWRAVGNDLTISMVRYVDSVSVQQQLELKQNLLKAKQELHRNTLQEN